MKPEARGQSHRQVLKSSLGMWELSDLNSAMKSLVLSLLPSRVRVGGGLVPFLMARLQLHGNYLEITLYGSEHLSG